MRIKQIVIPAYVFDKLQWKHHVSQEEVWEVLRRKPKVFFVEKGRVSGEDLYLALGQTNSGRFLSVFFIHKKNKDAIIISARDMARKERKRYES